jgi:hypothetical protein
VSLQIASDLQLPPEAVTQTFAILAKRGMGKTYTASVMVEEMLKAELQVIVIDPIGVWYGLRSSADGKAEGLPIIIAGGEHADVPITPEDGETLANLILDQTLSVVVDLSLFRKNETVKFMTDFAETLYRRSRQAIHLVLDEADAFAPQRPQPNEYRMLGAIEDIVRRGRARGIGVTMITQRPSVLNKNVLTQIEVLIALRLTAPLDQKAVDEWVRTHAEEGQREEFMKSLPSLPVGEAWFWSPGWLNIFQRVKVRTRQTLDSSSTPKAGQAIIKPTKMAAVDIEKIRSALEAGDVDPGKTPTKVHLNGKVSDITPEFVQQIINENVQLQQKLLERQKTILRTEQIGVVTREQIQELTAAAWTIIRELQKFAELSVVDSMDQVDTAYEGDPHDPYGRTKRVPLKPEPVNPRDWEGVDTVKIPFTGMDPAEPGTDKSVITGISPYAVTLLEAVARHYPTKLSRPQIAILAGRKPRSSAFGAALRELLDTGCIVQTDDLYEITEHGRTLTPEIMAAANPVDTWLNALPPYESALLKVLVAAYPKGVDKKSLAEGSGRSATSSAFGAALMTLRKNSLIEGNADGYRATDTLFMEKAKI